MIVVLKPDAEDSAATVREIVRVAERFPGIEARVYTYKGAQHEFIEVHLIGLASAVPTDAFETIPGVWRVVRISTRYRLIGRRDDHTETTTFEYNGVRFDDRTVNLFPRLCPLTPRPPPPTTI